MLSHETSRRLIYLQNFHRAVLDVVALCYCGMVVAVAAYLVLMLGVWHYEHAQEYSVRGQCVCVESPALALFSQDKDYAHKWRIFSFQTRHDSRVRRRRGDALLQQRQQLVDAGHLHSRKDLT